MVVIQVRGGKAYQFTNGKAASIWMKNFPKLYGHDMNNIAIYSDKKFSNALEIEEFVESFDEVIVCRGCHKNLKFTIEPTDVAFTVRCPGCNTSHQFHM